MFETLGPPGAFLSCPFADNVALANASAAPPSPSFVLLNLYGIQHRCRKRILRPDSFKSFLLPDSRTLPRFFGRKVVHPKKW